MEFDATEGTRLFDALKYSTLKDIDELHHDIEYNAFDYIEFAIKVSNINKNIELLGKLNEDRWRKIDNHILECEE